MCTGATLWKSLNRSPCPASPDIRLSDRTHRALKEAASQQNRSMGSIIKESLALRGIPPYDTAKEIVARVGAESGLSADEAMALPVEETRHFRDDQ